MPTEEFRLVDEEIKSAVEYEREKTIAISSSSMQNSTSPSKVASGGNESHRSLNGEEEFNFENNRRNKEDANGSTSSYGYSMDGGSRSDSRVKSMAGEQDVNYESSLSFM